MRLNLLENTDSYKTSHFKQYPPDTEFVSSYIESRGGKFSSSLFFGLQMFIKDYLLTPFTQADIDAAEVTIEGHGLPFNRAGWESMLKKHHGFLPLSISAVKEGSVIPLHQVLCQVVNTDPEFFWLTNYIETAILRAIWYPTTVATISFHTKTLLKTYLEETADTLGSLPFKLHDFGGRGASSLETAMLGGIAHLVNFMGTDTLPAISAAKQFYHEDMAGFSIPAAEHSTITSWGREHELDAYQNMLTQFGGKGKILAVVSDSYDLWEAIDHLWGDKLKDEVMNNGACLVVRPDSGDPASIVTECIERLMKRFGYTVNSKGYRVLPDYIRVIQGDGVDYESIGTCLAAIKDKNQSTENITFGMGGALLQKVNRDTLKFAMKASAVCRKGQWQSVFKDPITDPGKRSKKGRLALIRDKAEKYKTIPIESLHHDTNLLEPVFENGKLLRDELFADIRKQSLVS
jgi:nicotinamide phosphoribosyltransferase